VSSLNCDRPSHLDLGELSFVLTGNICKICILFVLCIIVIALLHSQRLGRLFSLSLLWHCFIHNDLCDFYVTRILISRNISVHLNLHLRLINHVIYLGDFVLRTDKWTALGMLQFGVQC